MTDLEPGGESAEPLPALDKKSESDLLVSISTYAEERIREHRIVLGECVSDEHAEMVAASKCAQSTLATYVLELVERVRELEGK